MPFGMKNALGSFQRATDVLLTECNRQLALVNSDDIAIFYRTLYEQIDHVSPELTSLHENVTTNLKNANFYKQN